MPLMNSSFHRVVLGVLFLSPVLWLTLVLTTTMDIRYDAVHFEKLAHLIDAQGWKAFLKQGPTLEPLYPFVISLSIKLGALTGISFPKIQAGLQVLMLCLSQLMLYRLLKLFRLNDTVVLITLIYFALSPAIINSSLSLFSENITFPLVLGCMLSIERVWQFILKKEIVPTVKWAIVFSILATILTLAKAVLEYVFIGFLFFFVLFAVQFMKEEKWRETFCTTAFLMIFLLIAQGSLLSYKALNKKYNGYFTLTDARGPYMFYHYAFKRTEVIKNNLLGVAVSSVPGEHVCRQVYGERCQDWWYDNYSFAEKKSNTWKAEGIPNDQIYSRLMREGFKQIAAHPLTYTLLTSFEAIKLLFWESTKVGFVFYPSWLQNIYDHTLFKNGLRLLVFLATAWALIYVLIYLFKNRRLMFAADSPEGTTYQQMFFVAGFVGLFVALYASVITITRYALPIASLYLTIIAFAAQAIFSKSKR